MHRLEDRDGATEAPSDFSRTRPVALSIDAEAGTANRSRAGTLLTTFVPGDLVADRFEILRFLGQGGMGQVFQARDLELGVSVALKVVRPDTSQEDAIRRFKGEVQLARQVTHPHVCRIYDLFVHHSKALREWGGRGRFTVLLTMEMLHGETLGQRLKRTGPFSPEEALPLVTQMAQALDAAHRVGVVHRDFKSSNVILVDTENGECRGAVITDFGLAVAYDPNRRDGATSGPASAAGGFPAVSGTPVYVAPELIAGGRPSVAADVYSFGVVLFEMMTGRLPFRAETPEKTARVRLEADPVPPSRHRPELSPTWDAVVLRCLSRDPKDRFARAGEAVNALAGPAEEIPRPGRWRGAALTTIAVAVAVLAFLLSHGKWWPAPGSTPGAATAGSTTVDRRPSEAFLGMIQISGSADSEWIATVLTEVLRSELTSVDGSQGPRSVPIEEVESWRERAMTNGRLLPEDLGQAHDLLGADFLVYGYYLVRSEHDLQVDVRLWDATVGRPIDSVIEIGHDGEVTELASRVGARFRSRLGGTTAAGEGRSAAQALEPGVVRAYAEGLKLLRRGEGAAAGSVFGQALAEAPFSPILLAGRAEAWAVEGQAALAAATARQAYELSGGLPWAERLRLEGFYRRTLYDWPRARQIYRSLSQVFPGSLDDALSLIAVDTVSERPEAALARVDDLRRRFPATEDPRLDLAEAWAARSRGDRERQREAGARAAGRAVGAELLRVQGLLLEGEALSELGKTGEAVDRETRLREILSTRGDRLLLARAADTWPQADLGLELSEALELFREAGDLQAEARVLIRLAYAQIVQKEDLTGAEEKLRRALEVATTTRSRQIEAEALNRLAILAFFREDQHQVLELFREASEAARVSGNLRLRAGILGNYAGHLVALGDLEAAQAALDETVQLGHRSGSLLVLCLALLKSSGLLLERGEAGLAEARLLEAERLVRGYGDDGLTAAVNRALGSLYMVVDSAKARQWLDASLKLWPPGSSNALISDLELVRWALGEGRIPEAEAMLRTVRSSYPNLDGIEGTSLRLCEALILLRSKRFEEARTALLAFPDASESLSMRHQVRRAKARVEAELGDARQALAVVAELAGEARALGYVLLELEDLVVAGEIEMASGDLDAGRADLARVAQRAREIGFLTVARRADRAAASQPGVR